MHLPLSRMLCSRGQLSLAIMYFCLILYKPLRPLLFYPKALACLLEASIYQSAGCDDVAMSTLLRANEAIDSIHQDDVFLRETLSATVLSEMG